MWKRKTCGILLLLLFQATFTSCSHGSGYTLERLIAGNDRTVKDNVYLNGENVGGLKESELLAKIKNYASEIDIEPQNASLDSNTWEVTEEKEGRKVDVEKTLSLVLDADEGEKVDLVVERKRPTVTAEDLESKLVVIGKYTTPLLDRSESRLNNIQLASERIDYKKLAPGEEFSFNKVVGRRTEAKGYEEAPIIIKIEGEPKKDYAVGGGICQLSTTIYNAVEECGLEVLERHIHSKDVGYVPHGEDATVSYGSADLRFRNNRSYPIMIRVYQGKKSLTVKIIENRNTA